MTAATAPFPRRPAVLRAAWRSRAALAGAAVLLATAACAAALPRDLLWGVESTCLLNYRTTGASFPCLEVNLDGGVERGFAVLRAPLRATHLVAMPTARTIGVETARLRAPDAANYFADAWGARRFIDSTALARKPGWRDIGLAVNSRLTRSQDQLHIHIACVRPRVQAALAERVAQTPTDRWQEGGYTYQGQPYWTRRVDGPSLAAANPFVLADEIPALRDRPGLATLAVIGVADPSGQDGFMLLAGESIPMLGVRQSTSEDLLDHGCRAFR